VEPTDALARRPVHVATLCPRCLTPSTLLLTADLYGSVDSLVPAPIERTSRTPARAGEAGIYRVVSMAPPGQLGSLQAPGVPHLAANDSLHDPDHEELTGERRRHGTQPEIPTGAESSGR